MTEPSMTSVSSGDDVEQDPLGRVVERDQLAQRHVTTAQGAGGRDQRGGSLARLPAGGGDLDLAYAHEVRDLGLGEAAHVAQLDDAPLAGGQLRQQRLTQADGVDGVEGAAMPSEVRSSTCCRRWWRPGGLAVVAGRLQGIQHFLDRRGRPGWAISSTRGAAEHLAQLVHCHLDGVLRSLLE